MRWSQAGQSGRSQALHRAPAALVGWKTQFISTFTSRYDSVAFGACPDSDDLPNRGRYQNRAAVEGWDARGSAPKKNWGRGPWSGR